MSSHTCFPLTCYYVVYLINATAIKDIDFSLKGKFWIRASVSIALIRASYRRYRKKQAVFFATRGHVRGEKGKSHLWTYDGRLKGRLTRGRDAGYLIFNPNTLEGDSVTDTPDLRGVTAHPMKSFSGVVPTRGVVPDRFPGRAEPSFHLVTRTIISIQFCLKISILKKRYQSNVKIYFLHIEKK